MAVSVNWYDEAQTLLCVKVTGGSPTPYEDFLTAAQQVKSMLSSVNHPVDAICDTSAQFAFSPRFLEIAYAVHKLSYPNIRLIVFVGKGLAWEFFQIFARGFGRLPYRFVAVKSEEAALKMIERVRLEASLAEKISAARFN